MAAPVKHSLRLSNVPIVTLHVGSPSRTFHLHRSLLCDASPVFEAAFSGTGTYRESESQSMSLEEDDAEDFEVITQWLYNRSVDLPGVLLNDKPRLATFGDWPHAKPSAAAMADAGFIHRPDLGTPKDKSGAKADAVTCDHYTPTQVVRNWTTEEDPTQQHLLWHPDCKFAQMVKDSMNPTAINDSDLNDFPELHCMRLVSVYRVAEKYGMIELKNELIDILFRLKRTEPRPKAASMTVVNFVYEGTPTKSPLRKLMVAWYTWHVNEEWYGHETTPALLNDVPEFAVDLACSMAQKNSKSSPFNGKSDAYHEHVQSPNRMRSNNNDAATEDMGMTSSSE